jgi:hypothetical protein
MKKRSLLSLLILLSPLLMANSPSPELYPDEYANYELTNESIIISEEESTKYITFSGNLQNTGEGIISFMDSFLSYSFEGNAYEIITDYYDDARPIQGLVPNQSYSFNKIFPYSGSAPLGTVTYSSRHLGIYGYQSDDLIQTIVISNQNVTSVSYSESNDETTFTYSFDWTNSGELSAQTIFFSFSMNDNDYVDYFWESISKNATGHSDLYVTIDGDVSTEEIENANFFFIRRSYESYGWNFSGFLAGLSSLIIFGLVIISLIVLAPIIVITIVIVVVNRKK